MRRIPIAFPITQVAVAGLLALMVTGCSSAPADGYPPPEQIAQQPEFRPYRVSRVIEMGPSSADRYIVSDIQGSSGDWRWTGRRPTIRVNVRTAQNVTFLIDFAVAGATFEDTGPVNVTFWVGGHQIGEMFFDEPGEGHFSAPVPPEWLEPDSETTVAAEVDKVWVAPTDGVELGIILTRMGLVQDSESGAVDSTSDNAPGDSDALMDPRAYPDFDRGVFAPPAQA